MEEVERFLSLNRWINSIADVGCGNGNYGWLVREKEERPHDREYWKMKLVGYEGYKLYEKSPQRQFYDNIIYGDIRSVDICDYDLVILIEVIEHLSKDDGIKLLKKLSEDNKEILFTTPNGFMDGGIHPYNNYGTHKCGYRSREIKRLGFNVYKSRNYLVGYSKGLRYFDDSFLVRLGAKIIPRSLKNKLWKKGRQK